MAAKSGGDGWDTLRFIVVERTEPDDSVFSVLEVGRVFNYCCCLLKY